MFLYKLRKLFREEGREIAKMSLGISCVFSSSIFIALLMLVGELSDGSRKEKIIMFSVLVTAGFINLATLLYLDYHIQYNIIVKLIVGIGINFLFYLPVFFTICVVSSYKDLKLNKAEERDAKLSSLLNKFR